jgi:AraC-like DNA-binding protein
VTAVERHRLAWQTGQRAPLGIGTTTYNDPDEYQASFGVAKINLVFACRGEFKARLTSVALPNLHLLSAQETLPRIASVSLAPNPVIVAFPTRFDSPIVWGGVELRRGDVIFHSRGEHMHHRTSGEVRWAIMSVMPEHLAKFGRILTGVELTPPPVGRILRPPKSAAMLLKRLHARACRLAQTNPEIIARREISHAMEQELLHALVNCVVSAEPVGCNTARQRHATLMSQFEEVLEHRFDCPLNAAEFCAAAGVSARILRLSCNEFLGVSPGHYDRLRRLNLVRAALRHADPASTSVSTKAIRHGFSEHGRFAVLYRTIFGETPSATLRGSCLTLGPERCAEFA